MGRPLWGWGWDITGLWMRIGGKWKCPTTGKSGMGLPQLPLVAKKLGLEIRIGGKQQCTNTNRVWSWQ